MAYRTKTYIAGDWTGDKDLIDRLYMWNESVYRTLHFVDAHALQQSRNTSNYCSIKRSLAERLRASKLFILIVGQQTRALTQGGCQYCASYSRPNRWCARGNNVDYRSYIEYECELAMYYGIRIVVIYNYARVMREKCPEILRNEGIHIPAWYVDYSGNYHPNYSQIKSAIMDY